MLSILFIVRAHLTAVRRRAYTNLYTNELHHPLQDQSPVGGFNLTQHTNTTQILELFEYHPLEYQWNCNRPSPIGNPFHTPNTVYDATPTANDQTATNAAFSTAMYAVLSDETSTFAGIAAFHNLPATCIQLPYKDMTWTLYANNFKRTLTRLQLYTANHSTDKIPTRPPFIYAS